MFIKKNHLKNYSYDLFLTFHSDMKPGDTKWQVTTQTNKMT